MENKDLDKWLAENVMDWEAYNVPETSLMMYRTKDTKLFQYGDRDIPQRGWKKWSPTTNIFQAFMCLEKILTRSWELKKSSGGGKLQYHCCYNYGKYTTEDTVEMAICMAAYRAKSGKSRFALHSIK